MVKCLNFVIEYGMILIVFFVFGIGNLGYIYKFVVIVMFEIVWSFMEGLVYILVEEVVFNVFDEKS